MKVVLSVLFLTMIFVTPVLAHPEFQRYFKETSGRTINCAMCHVHPDGPEGLKTGQIGSLTQDQLNTLGLARQANKPGSVVKSPILNEFGNLIVTALGKDKIMELKQSPGSLPDALSKTSDLDKDGIIDAEELKDGTNPLNSYDGKPLKLFKINLIRNWFDLFMIVLATGFGFYGLYNLLLWLSVKAGRKE